MTALEPVTDDLAPTADDLTAYDEARLILYLRLLDADAEGADWRDVARVVLRRDPEQEPAKSMRCWESHLARARWIARRRHDESIARDGNPSA